MRFASSLPRFARICFGTTLVFIATSLCAQTIIKSPSDAREYRALQLANGMKVMLVSDQNTDMAAASLSVQVGSSSNPQEWQGLAHFLEHMLFLGTEKYPQPGEYRDFIVHNGGGDNAYTAFDETNYFFRINATKLEPALDRFAQFFISPLFTQKYVDRERQVVNSEYLGGKKTDSRGIHSAVRAVMNPLHPNSTLSVGNVTTLADRADTDVRTEMIAFYQQHYSANLMTLTVLGTEPLDQLEAWVKTIFSPVPNHNREVPTIDVPMYTPGTLPARLYVKPERRQQRLILSFPLPAVREYWRAKPVQYIGHLLGHEGPGSLLAVLKAKGWAQGLSAGLGFNHSSSASMSIDIQLTPAGLEHQDEILALVFADIKLIRDKGIQRWVFDETRQLAEINFRFQEKPAPMSLVRNLSTLQHHFPAEEVLHGPFVYSQYRPELIRELLDKLTPDNMLLTIVSKDVKTNAVTMWYDKPYRTEPISAADQARWQQTPDASALALPESNPFIPEKLEMLAGSSGLPVPVPQVKSPGLLLFHQQDTEFGLPKANFYFTLRLPIANDSPRHSILTDLYVAMVNDQLNEYAYSAALAGLGFQLYTHMRGISVRVSGYADRQPELLRRILKTLTKPTLKAERFEILKAEFKRGISNRRRNPPYRQAMSGLRDLLVNPRWTDAEQLAVIDAIGFKELQQFIPRLLSRVDAINLAHGNINNAQAIAMSAQVNNALVLPAKAQPVERGQVLKLKRGDRIVKNIRVDNPESATVLYYQAGPKTLRQRVLTSLTSLIISSPIFEVLRTEKKLGYIVFANSVSILDVPGLAFTVQSPNTTTRQLREHIQAFIQDYGNNVEKMSEGKFEQHKHSLLTRVLEDERRLGEKTNRYWNEIDRDNYSFDTRKQFADTIRDLKLEEFKAFYKKVLLDEESRIITVYSNGNNTPAADIQTPAEVASALVLQETRGFYPRD